MKMKLTLIVAALISVVGSATYLRSSQGQSNESFIGRSFVVTFSRYRQSDPTKSQTIIQVVNSQGRSLVRRIGRDGRDIEHVVHQYDHNGRRAWADRAAYQRSAHVIRTEQVAGITAYVIRQDVGGQMLERWYAPETGLIPLKEILEVGEGEALVTQATNIEFREVSDGELEPQVDLIVKHPSQ